MMSMHARQEYAREVSDRYRRASRKEKGSILNEFIKNCGYNRKYAVSLLRDPPPKRSSPVKRPRGKVYGEEVRRALVDLWNASDRLCSKRLVPFLEELIEALERHGELEIAPLVRERLVSLSAATADRLLGPERRRLGWRGLTTTKPGTLLRQQIAVRTANDWEEDAPGFFEADLVSHCGATTAGEYLNTLTLTDVATGWVEVEALANRSQITVCEAVERIRRRLAYPIRAIDSDNGSEFINAHLSGYCKKHQITFTRCRPYIKNDQCRVEQKNWSVVRAYTGFARLEGEDARRCLAALYSYLRPFVNYLQPSMKLSTKLREGAKVTKRYHQAKTPYKRLLEHNTLDEQTRNDQHEYYLALNPAQLRRHIRKAQERLDEAARVRFTNEATKAA